MIDMTETTVEQRWYAIRTRPRHEKVVSRLLFHKGYEQFLPQYKTHSRWADRLKQVDLPLFPGYVFCRFNARYRVPVLNTAGVIDIVRAGIEPAPVENDEIESIRKAVDSGLNCFPWEHLDCGERVTITFGPLAGVSGTVVEIKKEPRLVLSVSLLNRFVLVELDAEMLACAERPRPARHPAIYQATSSKGGHCLRT